MKLNTVCPQELLSTEDWQTLTSFFELLIEADKKEQSHIKQEGKCDEYSRKIASTKF